MGYFGASPENAQGIMVHEGEKAGEAGAKLLPKWCHVVVAGGAARLPDASWQWLEPGAAVYLFPDGDDQGRKCMEALAARLHGMGFVVHRVPDLGAKDNGKGKDAADWPADDPDGFRELVTGSPRWQPQGSTTATARPGLRVYSDAELRVMELPPLKWVLPEILPEGLGILSGPPKSAKSAWAVALADSIGGGADSFMGKQPDRGGVIYVDAENGPRRNQDRARTLFPKVAPGLRYVEPEPGWLFDDSGMADIESEMAKMAADYPVRLVVLDTLEKTVPQPKVDKGQKLDRYQSDTLRFGPLKRWANRHGVCLLLVHHGAKSAARTAQVFDSMSGSVGVTAGADSLLTLTAAKGSKVGDSDSDGKRLYSLDITGKDVRECELALEREGWRWRFLGPVGKVLISDATKETVSWIAAHPGCTRLEVYKALGISRDTGKKRIRAAMARGLIEEFDDQLFPLDYDPLGGDSPLSPNTHTHLQEGVVEGGKGAFPRVSPFPGCGTPDVAGEGRGNEGFPPSAPISDMGLSDLGERGMGVFQ
jgi:hypothetical protein